MTTSIDEWRAEIARQFIATSVEMFVFDVNSRGWFVFYGMRGWRRADEQVQIEIQKLSMAAADAAERAGNRRLVFCLGTYTNMKKIERLVRADLKMRWAGSPALGGRS